MINRRKKNIMILTLCVVLVFMGIGYAFLTKTLTIGGTSKVTGKWKIVIDNIVPTSTGGNAVARNMTISEDKKSATFTADLYDTGDYVEYTITVKNYGNIAAKLNSVNTSVNNGSQYVKFTNNASRGTIISPDSSMSFTARVYVDNPSDVNMPDAEGIQFVLNLDFIQSEEVKPDDPNKTYALFTEDISATRDDDISYTYTINNELIISGTGKMKNLSWIEGENFHDLTVSDIDDLVLSLRIPLRYIVAKHEGMDESDLYCEIQGSKTVSSLCPEYKIATYYMSRAIDITDFLEQWDELDPSRKVGKTWLKNLALNYTGIKSLEIRDGITTIGNNAFVGIRVINQTLTIPDTVSEIGQNAFAGTNFSIINFPNNPEFTIIPKSFCQSCIDLSELIIPDSVTIIKESAFQNHKNLESIDFGTGVNTIEEKVFFSNYGILTSITIPGNITTIGTSAFSNASGTYLTSVTLSGGDTTRFDADWHMLFQGATKIVQ